MIFYLGTHMVGPAWWAAGVPLFVSRRRLHQRRTMPEAKAPWALDSGGFTEVSMYGEWRTSEREYVADVRRFQHEIGHLDWVAPQDWMCEPFVLEQTGLTLERHLALTVENLVRLRAQLGALVVPVLQGWELDDYLACVELYDRAGVDLASERVVGIGSVCRRQNTAEAGRIVRRLAAEGLRLHGFGVKTTGLRAFGDALESADSMAWSLAARRRRRPDDVDDPQLFPVGRVGLCGSVLRSPDHPAKSCANCLPWALRWRREEVPNEKEVAA